MVRFADIPAAHTALLLSGTECHEWARDEVVFTIRKCMIHRPLNGFLDALSLRSYHVGTITYLITRDMDDGSTEWWRISFWGLSLANYQAKAVRRALKKGPVTDVQLKFHNGSFHNGSFHLAPAWIDSEPLVDEIDRLLRESRET